MKIIKRLIIAIVVLAILFVGAGFAASQFINKELVEKQMSQALNREVHIQGALKPVFSLTPSVQAENVTLGNARWGSRAELAKIGSFEIKLQLLPLLSKKIVIDKITIDNADIILEQKNGQWNFDFQDATAKSVNEKQKPVSEKQPMSFNISELAITNSHLLVNQGGAPTDLVVKSLKLAPHDSRMSFDFDGSINKRPLKVSADLPPVAELMGSGKPFDIASLTVESEDVKLKAAASIDMAAKKAEIKNLDVQKGDIKISAKGKADINARKVDLTNLSLAQGNLKFTGALSVDAGGKKPYMKGTLSADTINLPAKNAGGDKGDKPDAPGKASDGNGATYSDSPLPLDSLDAANADLNLKIAHLKSGNIQLDNISATVKLNNGVLSIAPLNAAFAGGQIASNLVLSKGGTRLSLKGSNLTMEKILAQTAGFNDFKNGATNIDLALSGSGNSVAKIVNSLGGTSKITIGKATYTGEILKGRAAQFSNLLYGNSGGHELDINCAVTSINWSAGTGTFQQLGVDTRYANISGTGSVRLPNQGINLNLTPVSKLPALNSLALPIVVKGTFSNPQVATGQIATKLATTIGKNVLNDFLAAKQSGGKFKLDLKKSAGIDKTATVASPCGATSVTIAAPSASQDAPTAPATAGTAAPASTGAPVAGQPDIEAPQAPLSKKQKKAQQINNAIKAFGF